MPAVLSAHAGAVARGEEDPWSYATTLLWRNAAGHAFRDEGKTGKLWFYAPSLLGGAAPWCALWPAAALALARWRDAKWRDADRLAIAWTLPSLVAFSLFRAKRDLYLLPFYPGLALLAGLLVARIAQAPERARNLLVRGPLHAMFGALVLAGLAGLGGAAALPFGLEDRLARIPGYAAEIAPGLDSRFVARAAALAGVSLLVGALGLRALGRGALGLALAAAAAGGLLASLVSALVLMPIEDRTNGTRPLAERALVLAREAGGARIGLYGPPDEGDKWMFYLARTPLPQLHTAQDLEAFLAAEGGGAAVVVALDHPGLAGVPLARGYWRGRQIAIVGNEAAAERVRAGGDRR